LAFGGKRPISQQEGAKHMTEGDISIRHAAAADLPAVRALLTETWHDTYDTLLGAEWVTEVSGRWHAIDNLRKQLDVPGTTFLVAVDQGRIVGHILVDARKPPALVILRLYVLPAHQRGGVGARLLAAAVAEHPESELMRLDVEARNEKGVAFYRRAGFEEVGRTVIEGSEHLVMEKALASAAESRRFC
jgi:ribosomal protein S18 acetylase RimI-like enzyme